ncbi:thioesterase domain-containing protein [Brucella sp. 2716]|uniref:thioesterase domain-containing protein n=1 Tax=Brucella sp. 2716 TaxID=2975052 RepID=UPI00217EB5C6|nr:thioesterase domain-containing protein [Brucella sp. 2716]UWF60234.1 thioesterase domain-containing protein [Brucella sp. 2716]
MNRRSLLLGLLAGAALVFPSLPAAAKTQQAAVPPNATSPHQADVYLLRGFGDIFSTGIDEIGAELQAAGVNAHVHGHAAWRLVLNRIVADQQKNGHLPVVLIGHSLGANAAIYIAEELERRGIAVDYMATFAATGPDPLPGNVRRVVNFYFKQHGWGLPLVPGPRFHGHLENRDFSNAKDVGHFNIEKQRPLQAEVVRDVLAVVNAD